MKPVFALVISYRRLDALQRTCESLLLTLPSGSRMVIVDNNSPDYEVHKYIRGLVEMHKPGSVVSVSSLILDSNKGWAHAVNEGLGHYNWRAFDFVLESNNDVEYEADWAHQAQGILRRHENIGLLGLWKHINHAERRSLGDVVIKDDMPAVAWLFRSKDLEKFLPFPEKGPCNTRGGNGEDSDMVRKVQAAGFDVAGPREDLAHHLDGYDNKGGAVNEAYL